MGEMADAIIDGEFDYETGEYIGGPVGYPRTIFSGMYTPRYIIEPAVERINQIMEARGRDTRRKRKYTIVRYLKEKTPDMDLSISYTKMCKYIVANHVEHFKKWMKHHYGKTS